VSLPYHILYLFKHRLSKNRSQKLIKNGDLSVDLHIVYDKYIGNILCVGQTMGNCYLIAKL